MRAERLWLVAGALALAAVVVALPRMDRELRSLIAPARTAGARPTTSRPQQWTDRFGTGRRTFCG